MKMGSSSTGGSLFAAAILFGLLFLRAAVETFAWKLKVPASFIFGDSLLDVGNNNHITGYPLLPQAIWPYGETYFHRPTGRWCNGRLIFDFIAEYLGLPYPKAYLAPFSGPIPQNITACKNLEYINLEENLPTGEIPENLLSGPISNSSIKCSNGSYCNHFWVQNNNLSGDIVDFLIDCYNYITDFRLANNSFSGDLMRIANINSSSVDLALRGNNLLNGYLDLNNNHLQMSRIEANRDPLGAMLEYFVLCTSVLELRMQGNDFSRATLPAYLPAAANYIQYLDLSNNHLKVEISVASFNSTGWPTLQFLNLSSNGIRGSVPETCLAMA